MDKRFRRLNERSQWLNALARQGDIDAFYIGIQKDVTLLEDIDKFPFVTTPLHESASAGHIPFSILMMKLKPSFISKPNLNGDTPICLALSEAKIEMVRQLLQHNVDLVHVKGKECMTPLHYAAKKIGWDYLALLENFLSVCPDSITDVTTRNQTALHIALENNNLEAFTFLVGWLRREWPHWRKILEQKDVEGNTVLHIAVSKNKTKAVSLILAWGATCFNVNEKNLKNETALDLLNRREREARETPEAREAGEARVACEAAEALEAAAASALMAPEALEAHVARESEARNAIRELLASNGALLAASCPTDTPHEKYLELPGCCERTKILFIGNRLRKRISEEKRNALLVVAALLVTVTYQAILSPPGGLWQEDLFESNTTDVLQRSPDDQFELNITAPHRAGSAIARGTFAFRIFMVFNSIIFVSSITTMAVLVPPEEVVGVNLMVGVSVSLCFGYFSSLMIITQAPDCLATIVPISLLIIIIVAAALIIIRKDSIANDRNKKNR